ncbi:MAG: sensor histidine kinase [Sphingomicrobium sp.]
MCPSLSFFRGARIRRVLVSRLPERLAGRVPPLLTAVAVGLFCAIAGLGARMTLIPFAGDRAPYMLVFATLVLASVVAGWRSGLVALISGQLLTWYIVLEPRWTFVIEDPENAAGLVLATLSELAILVVIALYQRVIDAATVAREQRLDLLSEALREIDHRTRNNYQTVLALVILQARQATNGAVRGALQQVANRIRAVSLAAEKLALRSDDLGTVRLGDHLSQLCAQLNRGLARENVRVECEHDELVASAEKAIYISVIVNELVTNALKHAFDEPSGGVIRVSARQVQDGAEFHIEDNGSGIRKDSVSGAGGLGTKLVTRFARQLGATHHISSSSKGTTHKLVVPSLH